MQHAVVNVQCWRHRVFQQQPVTEQGHNPPAIHMLISLQASATQHNACRIRSAGQWAFMLAP